MDVHEKTTVKYTAFITHETLCSNNRLSADLSALYHPNTISGCSPCKTHHKSQDGLEPGDSDRKKEERKGEAVERGVLMKNLSILGHFSMTPT